MRQARLAAWISFELAGSFSNAWVSTLTSWKPSKACTPGTTRASVSIWVMRCSTDVSCFMLSSRAVVARSLVTCLTAAKVWQRVPAAQPQTEKALPWSVLRYNEDLDAYELNVADDQLRRAPALDTEWESGMVGA